MGDTWHIKLINAIGLGLKELRIERGYTSYEQFAIANDLDRKQYWRAENGANMTLKSLSRILAIHELPMSIFFREYVEGSDEIMGGKQKQ